MRKKSPPLNPPTWPEAIDAFDARLELEEKSPLTRKNYREDLTAFATWYARTYEEPATVKGLTAQELREWKGYLREARGLKPATCNRKLAALKSFLRWAEAAGFAPGVATPKMLRQGTQPPRWLTRREQRSLLRVLDHVAGPRGERDRAMVALLLHAGLRVAELVALKWDDLVVRPRSGQLTVRSGKGRKQRIVPLALEARQALEATRKHGRGPKPVEVLLGQRGPLTIRGVESVIAKYGKAARLEDLSPHTLRHSFCKNLADAGRRLETIAALAGHESLETTRRYVEPGLDDLAAAVELSGGEED